MSRFYEQIRRYYVEGYGMPKQYYTDVQLDAFVTKGLLNSNEAAQIRTLTENKLPAEDANLI